MRMNPESGDETAAELIARLNEKEIANVIYELGEERFSRRIARRIVEARKSGEPVETTKQLAELVRRSVPRKKNQRVNPATKTFQALRIKINRELEILEQFLIDAVDILKPDGRLAVISFHSLEDRIVKRTFHKLSGRCSCPRNFPLCVCGAAKKIEVLTKRPVSPAESEQNDNPRSRSAKIRACRKLGEDE
jgi:16S rRNA (cytosine1402-N4)-methyltransferase